MVNSKFLLLLAASGAIASPALLTDQWSVSMDGGDDGLLYGDVKINLDEMRLVQFEGQDPVWISEQDKIHAKAEGRPFFDITDTPNLGATPVVRISSEEGYPSPSASSVVTPVLKSLSTDGPRANLEKFTSFRTRYYRSDSGRESQQWLLSRISEITEKHAPDSLKEIINISEFPHSWGQNSIIVKINGSEDTSSVIISAHQDSTNLFPFLPAPGADDDGSGSVTILETYRGLITAGFRPKRTVEFHWYAAEEGGLLGSQAVAQAYKTDGADVYAQLQFDMTAWHKEGTREEIGLITDFVDKDLTKFLAEIIDAYSEIPYVYTKCGYACSDHASWDKAGYPGSFLIESEFGNSNKNIHSTNDRIDISPEFSFDHLLHFSKVGAAFAIELAGWKK